MQCNSSNHLLSLETAFHAIISNPQPADSVRVFSPCFQPPLHRTFSARSMSSSRLAVQPLWVGAFFMLCDT